MKLTKKQLDELTGGCKTPKDVESLYSQMLQHMINRSLEAEMDVHLGYERFSPAAAAAGENRRNGKTRKRVQSEIGTLEIETPRDREGNFEPQLVWCLGNDFSQEISISSQFKRIGRSLLCLVI